MRTVGFLQVLLLSLTIQTAFGDGVVARSARDGSLKHIPAMARADLRPGSGRPAAAAQNDQCQALLDSGEVSICEPNVEIHINALPNDPFLSQQWAYSPNNSFAIGATGAWDISSGSNQIVVAEIDSGVDFNHPDLASNIWVNPGEIAGNGIDDDNNGFIDDVHGVNFVTPGFPPMDDNGHGTHVAGIMGAHGNDGVGVSGVNWNVSIIPVKALDSAGSGSLYDAIRAVDYIVDLKTQRGVNVTAINASWGMGFRSDLLQSAIQRANDAGIIMVAAAGNSSNNADVVPQFPAAYPLEGVISVAAIDQSGNLAPFSNYGPGSVDIAAPGVAIFSTFPDSKLGYLSGTSMATPFVTGALALLASSEPLLSVAARRERLLGSGTELASLRGAIYSGRTLNIAHLLGNQTSPFTPPAGNYAPPPVFDLSVLYLDRSWSTGQKRNILLVGDAGERAHFKVKFPHGSCSLSNFTLPGLVTEVTVRVPSTGIVGGARLELYSASNYLIESHNLRLKVSSRHVRQSRYRRLGVQTTSATRRDIRAWCRSIRYRVD